MLWQGWKTVVIDKFAGEWSRFDQAKSKPERASRARNVRYDTGQVGSREGTTAVFASSGKVTDIIQWIANDPTAGPQNRIFYYDNGSVKMRNLLTSTNTTLYSLSARGIVGVSNDSRFYIAGYNTDGRGTGVPKVTNILVGGTPADDAYAPPMTDTVVVTDNGAGQCTGGAHKFGYIVTTRTGFTGRPAPAGGSPSFTHAPVSFTVAAGGRKLLLTVTATWPSDVAWVTPIATRSDNLAKFFFAGPALAVAGGYVGGIGMTMDISDENLASNTVVDEYFDLYVRGASTGPTAPPVIATYGRRMVSIMGSKAYFSDQDDAQRVTEALHVKQVPGALQLTNGKQLREVFYLFGPNWTFSVVDNTDKPSTWGGATLISNAIGTLSPYGVAASTAGDNLWVAHQTGLYYFQHGYQQRDGRPLPISFYQQSVWARINWGAAYAVKVLEDPVNNVVKVLAPLDGATEPSHILHYDFTNGVTPELVQFSLDDYATAIASAAMVQNGTTGKSDMWLGPQAANPVVKTSLADHSDNAIAMPDQVWETGLIVAGGDSSGKRYQFGGCGVTAIGDGDLSFTAYGKGRTKNGGARTITLATTGVYTPIRKFDLTSENATVRLTLSGAGKWFRATEMVVKFKQWVDSF